MPAYVFDYFAKAHAFVSYIVEDTDLKGGFQCVATLADRDAILMFAQKVGMLVYVEEDDTIYQLESIGVWKEFEVGGGGFGPDDISPPLVILDGKLTVDPRYVLPDGAKVGQVPRMEADGIEWVYLDPSEVVGTRQTTEYTIPTMQPGDHHNFELNLAKTAMLVRVEINAFDVEIKGYGTNDRDEINPYTFVSKQGYFIDEGVKYDEDGEATFMRRHALVANRDDPTEPTLYFTARNIGGFPTSDTKIIIEYVVME